MKRKIYYIAILVMAALLSSCLKDEIVPAASINVRDVEVKSSYTTATISCYINSSATIGEIILEYANDSAFANFREQYMLSDDYIKSCYNTTIDSLLPNTKYYIRCKVVNKVNSYTSDIHSFLTKKYRLATIQTDSIDQIDLSSATLHATLLERGVDKEISVGFYIATNPKVSNEDSCIVVSTNAQKDSLQFSYSLSNLEDGTTYFVRAFTKNNIGISYGEEKSFMTTEMLPPSVDPVSISFVSYTKVSCHSKVTTDGGGTVTERGFCYSTSQNPTVENNKIVSGVGTGSFSATIKELNAGTQYYIRAYATNKKGTSYGEQTTFTTMANTPPSVTTSQATDITYTSAVCGGEVTNDGGLTISERGICYSTSEMPTTSDNKVACGSGLGNFIGNISGLAGGLTYYVRAYAVNGVGVSYGNQVVFKAKEYELPIVTTNSKILDITYNSAICSGSVTYDGGLPILERGVCYSTSQNPTIESKKVAAGSGLGDFTCNITGLVAHYTRYYIRAYATNSVGTAYGEQMTFVTATYSIPIFNSNYVSVIEESSVMFQVTIMEDGGMPVTSRGFCYSKAPNPTISSSKYQCGSGTGSYSCTISGLDKGATYYVRAYATNSQGTAYLDCGTINF